MFISEALSINKKGSLSIGGCDVHELAEQYGTPLYIMDESLIRKNCRTYKEALEKYYGSKGMVLYAGKAFSTMAMCKIINDEGLGIDVVSGGELYTAIKAQFPPEKIFFHGNYKSESEIKMAIDYNIARFVVDNREDLYRIDKIAGIKGKTANISFRLKPGIEAHTHDFVQTGQIDSKFGVSMENGEAVELIKEALTLKNVKVIGVHCHIGSQIFEVDPFVAAAKVMINFISKIKNETGHVISELNLGGGFGIKYLENENPVSFNTYIEAVADTIGGYCKENNIEKPFLIFEPGRSIVASAGITLYTVVSVKNIKDVRKYILVDGSMADNPRYALYGSEYECVVCDKPDAPGIEKVTIAGRTCESGDIIIKDIMMPEIKTGDLLAVLATGAYNYSMSSNYNRLPRPAVVMVRDGKHRLIVKAETYDDIVRNDV